LIRTAGNALTASSVKSAIAQNSMKDLFCAQFVIRQLIIGVCNHNLLNYPNAVGNVPIALSVEHVEQKNFSALKISKTKLIWIQIRDTRYVLTLSFVSNVAKTNTGSHFAKFAMQKLDLD